MMNEELIGRWKKVPIDSGWFQELVKETITALREQEIHIEDCSKRNETDADRIAELEKESDELSDKCGEFEQCIAELEAALTLTLTQAIATDNVELEAGSHEKYCPHGARWGECICYLSEGE